MVRCSLCGGRLINGKCVECGLDNTKNDRKYKLNSHNDKEIRFHPGDCEENLNQERDSSEDGRQRKSSRNTGAGGNASRQSGDMASKTRQMKALKERSQTGTAKKRGGLIRVIFWIVLLVILFQIFGGVLTGIFSEIRSSGISIRSLTDKLGMSGYGDEDWDRTDDEEEFAAAGEASAEKPEEIIWNEQSSGYFEEGLTMGIYTVGYEIPAGSYQMFCDQGTAWCHLVRSEEDSEFFALYSTKRQESYAETFGECEYFELSGELTLEEGDRIYVEECDEGVFIKGEGSGEASLQRHKPQNLQEIVNVEDTMTAGEDFLPGVYDVALEDIPEDEYGSAYLNITSKEGEESYIPLHQEMPVFYRFLFREGDCIELTAYGASAAVTLTPSY